VIGSGRGLYARFGLLVRNIGARAGNGSTASSLHYGFPKIRALSFAVDRLHLGSLSTAIALAVALVKASIVFAVFMHLDREPFAIRFVAALNVAWVLLLCLGIAADVVMLAT
jgi:caa(3)-type oxidase subunit IV